MAYKRFLCVFQMNVPGGRLCLWSFICIPGAFVLLLPPGLVFRFNAFSCLSDAFSFRKRCVICPRERKWLISDSCAFSDERPGRLCFRSITQESALLWSCRFVSDIYRGETARHGFRGAGFASGFKSCRAVPDI